MLEHRLALLVLNSLPGIGPGRKRALVELFGSAENALAAPREQLCTVPKLGPKLSDEIIHWQDYCNPEEEINLAQRAGACIITEEDTCYPPLLREIHDPPICLYVLGDLNSLKNTQNAIAIVGSRFTTPYGIRMAELLARDAAQTDTPVISGLARGIDTAAHRATLNVNGITIAVIGSGLLNIYPNENIPLVHEICAKNGAVITEFPMRYRPDKRTFPMRNRIISGIARGTIVVQAGIHSGSLITAGQALDQNRTVFAVPGPADIIQSHGCHALIKDGAKLIESYNDVLEEFSQFPNLCSNRDDPLREKPAPVEQDNGSLSTLENHILQLVKDEEQFIDDVLEQCNEPPQTVLACILTMELRRLVKQLPGKRLAKA